MSTPHAPETPALRLGQRERWLGWASGSIFLVMLGLFHLIQIEGAVIASGQTVVQGKPRPVQSLDAGIAKEIRVADGDRVAAGEVLIQLDQSILEVNRDILRGRLSELTARHARLAAESTEAAQITTPPVPPGIDPAALAAHVTAQQKIFAARQQVRESQTAQLYEQIAQYQSRIQGVSAQIEAAERQAALLEREIANLTTLNTRNLVPESRLLELEGRLEALRGQGVTLHSEREGHQNGIRNTQLEIIKLARGFREEVTTELREVLLQLEETQLELARTAAELTRLEIRAPVNGVVHELQILASGAVVTPGDVLLSVIPLADGVEFDLEVAPDAIDSVYAGQEARMRFPAFNQNTTPEIFGQIVRISPDSILDRQTGRRFFRVAVSVPHAELLRLGEAELVPGMPVEALLQTGSRSILSYLVKPITDQMAHAFREG